VWLAFQYLKIKKAVSCALMYSVICFKTGPYISLFGWKIV
jgi:hypothetical protein